MWLEAFIVEISSWFLCPSDTATAAFVQCLKPYDHMPPVGILSSLVHLSRVCVTPCIQQHLPTFWASGSSVRFFTEGEDGSSSVLQEWLLSCGAAGGSGQGTYCFPSPWMHLLSDGFPAWRSLISHASSWVDSCRVGYRTGTGVQWRSALLGPSWQGKIVCALQGTAEFTFSSAFTSLPGAETWLESWRLLQMCTSLLLLHCEFCEHHN